MKKKPSLWMRFLSWHRLLNRQCPECGSVPHIRDACEICQGYDEAQRGYAPPPTLYGWKHRWRKLHGLKYLDVFQNPRK